MSFAKKLFPRVAVSALVGWVVMGAAHAESPTYTFKLGGIYIDPRATSTALEGTLPTGLSALPTVPVHSGNQLEVQSKSTVMFSLERHFDENWSAELVMGIPPTHDVKLRVGDGTRAAASSTPTSTAGAVSKAVAAHVVADDGQVVARVKQQAPTVFLNYAFFDAKHAWRPYVGIGVNYTKLTANATDVGTSLYNDGPVRISLTDSFGWAFQTGVKYKINDQWSLNAGWATAAVRSNITIRTNNSQQTAMYRFHPSAFSMSVGYSF